MLSSKLNVIYWHGKVSFSQLAAAPFPMVLYCFNTVFPKPVPVDNTHFGCLVSDPSAWGLVVCINTLMSWIRCAWLGRESVCVFKNRVGKHYFNMKCHVAPPQHKCWKPLLSLTEIGTERACFRDMSSFPETKAEKYVNRIKGKKFLQYNRLQLSRIYPRGQRLDSSNYDPLPMWLCGSQLVALNFQTAGEHRPRV